MSGHALQQKGWKELELLPFIARRACRYERGDGTFWARKKGELLRPDAFDRRVLSASGPLNNRVFETLYQQNPGRHERLRLKVEHFPLFVPTAVQSGSADSP